MADKRISQLVDRGTVANNDVVPIVVSGATTTNKATISSIQTFMQGNLDLGVTSVGITLGSSGTDVSVSGSPITSSGNITINLPTASATNRGLLSSADWSTFNNKQAAGNYVTTDTTQSITGVKTFDTGSLILAAAGTANSTHLRNSAGDSTSVGGSNVFGFNSGNNIYVSTQSKGGFILAFNNSVSNRQYDLPNASGTIALVGGTGVGTVTSVAALTLGTSGTDLSSTVANGTTTPVITLNVPTASATNRGALSSADWTTFNNKQNALTNPITGTGATGQVAYWSGTNSQAGSNNLFWDNANVKLGIGTNTPESTGLTIAGGGILVSLDSGAARKVLELYATSTGAKVSSTYVGASSYGSLELLTSNEARLTITAAGEVGIGTPAPVTNLDIQAAISGAYTTSSSQAPLRVFNVTNAGGINSSVISFQCSTDNSASNPVARIGVVGESAGSNNGAMVMMTRDGSGVTERMRITSGGELFWKVTDITGAALTDGGVTFRDSTSNKFIQVSSGVSTDALLLAFYKKNGSGVSNTGTIETSGNSTLYNTTSDYRLKENVKNVEDALLKLNQLKPCTFNYISDSEKIVMGFLAHEVQEVMPQAVTGKKDNVKIEKVEVCPAELDEEGNIITDAVIEEQEVPVYQGIDHSKLVPLLVAAMQEQQYQIQELKTEIDSLKNQIK